MQYALRSGPAKYFLLLLIIFVRTYEVVPSVVVGISQDILGPEFFDGLRSTEGVFGANVDGSVEASGLSIRQVEISDLADVVQAVAGVVVEVRRGTAVAVGAVGVNTGILLVLGEAVFRVELVTAGRPGERVGRDGSDEVPNGPGDNHVVEQGQESANADHSLREKDDNVEKQIHSK